MKAAVLSQYRGEFSILEVAEPRLGRESVLVRVLAAPVTAGDARIRSSRFPPGFGLAGRLALGVFRPRTKTLGSCYSGVVTRVGEEVHGIEPGDEVAGMTGAGMGAHAEFVAAPAASLTPKPADLTHEQAAGLLFGGSTALHFLRDRAGIRSGSTVLVNGASGALGTSAVQLAKHFGARVTAVTSAKNAEFVRGLGAEEIIDYEREPITESSTRYDIVFDAVGNISRSLGLTLLRAEGSLILAVAGLADTVRARGPVIAGVVPERAAILADVLRLGAEGKLDPVTEIAGGLDQINAAFALVDTGRKVGNLVIRLP